MVFFLVLLMKLNFHLQLFYQILEEYKLPSERPSLMSIRTTSLATSRQAITFAQVAPTAPAPTTVTLDIAFYFLCLAYQLFVIRGAQRERFPVGAQSGRLAAPAYRKRQICSAPCHGVSGRQRKRIIKADTPAGPHRFKAAPPHLPGINVGNITKTKRSYEP